MVDGAAGAVVVGLDHFHDALRWIFQAEGGLTNDSGGLTRYGISAKAHPNVDVEHLTRDRATAIYRESYWLPIHGPELPPALALVLFDAAVNMGVPKAVEILQTVLRHVAVDGVMGRETLIAARAFLPRPELVALCLELRLREYDDIAKRDGYGRYAYGWRMRVMRLALEAGTWRGL